MAGGRDVLEVARFSTIPEAELAASFLNQHGVKAWLPDRDMATICLLYTSDAADEL